MQHDAHATCMHNIMHAVVMGYALIGVGPPHIYACSFIILICIYLYIFNTLPYNELRSYAAVLRRRGSPPANLVMGKPRHRPPPVRSTVCSLSMVVANRGRPRGKHCRI